MAHSAVTGAVWSAVVAAHATWGRKSPAGFDDGTIFAPLTPATVVSDAPSETIGDISLGFSVAAPEGWSGFLRGDYLFAADHEAWSGNTGLRYSW